MKTEIAEQQKQITELKQGKKEQNSNLEKQQKEITELKLDKKEQQKEITELKT